MAENVDPNTGTTVAVAGKALELVAEKTRGTSRDPFAYVGPFETNRQGEKQLYLWIGAPQDKGELLEPELFCDDQKLVLTPLDKSMQELGLSQPPYAKPAPWTGEWFYYLSDDNLNCLAEAKRVMMTTKRKANPKNDDTFSAQGKELAVLAAFAASR